MARYQYAGPAPVTDPDSGEVVRPGDVREFPAEPAYGPWELLDGPDAGPRRIGDDVPIGGAPEPPPVSLFAKPTNAEGM